MPPRSAGSSDAVGRPFSRASGYVPRLRLYGRQQDQLPSTDARLPSRGRQVSGAFVARSGPSLHSGRPPDGCTTILPGGAWPAGDGAPCVLLSDRRSHSIIALWYGAHRQPGHGGKPRAARGAGASGHAVAAADGKRGTAAVARRRSRTSNVQSSKTGSSK